MTRMLFINAIDTTKPVQTRYPPLGIGYLVSSLRKRFGEDAIEFKVVDSDVERHIATWRPDIVGISAVSQNFNRAIEYAAIAKRYGASVWCGGVHISMMPESLTADMDVGVIGEGEGTVCELMGVYLKERRLTPTVLSTIDGIAFHTNGHIALTDDREPLNPLDDLPPPARDLFPVHPETYMFTARGCSFRCAFCASTRFWASTRSFSPAYIVDEIAELVERHGVTTICLYDDIFPINSKRIRQCVDQLRARGLLGKVRFTCSIRANLVTTPTIRELKRMGVTSIGVGMESGNIASLRYLKGPTFTPEDNEHAIDVIRAEGIHVHGSFIIGSPAEGREGAEKTLEFIRRHRLSSDLYLLTPFPGTPVWDYALKRGLVSPDMDWSRLDVDYQGREDAVVVSTRMTKSEIDAVFAKYRQQCRRMGRMSLATAAIRRPWKVPGYLWGKFAGVAQ